MMVDLPDAERTRRQFDEDGFAAFRPLFDEASMSKINSELDRILVDVVPRMPGAEVYREDPSDPHSVKQLQKLHTHDEWARVLFEDGPIRAIAEIVLGEAVIPIKMQYFNKPPGIGQPTPPHQDGAFFHLEPCEAVTGWLALEPVDEENGCVHYVRGSHAESAMRTHAPSGVLGFSQSIADFGTDDDRARTVAMPGGPGTFLIHHAKTIHWAGANRSQTRSRRALGFIYYAQSARRDEAAHAAYQEKLRERLRSEGRIEGTAPASAARAMAGRGRRWWRRSDRTRFARPR